MSFTLSGAGGARTAAPSSATSPPDDSEDPHKGQKRARASRPKVKTGCSSCKLGAFGSGLMEMLRTDEIYRQRRIKCDEKRPACSQCVRSNKECTGYPPPPRHAVRYAEVRLVPRPAPVTQPVLFQGTGPLRKEIILPPRRINRRQQKDVVRKHVVIEPSPTVYRPATGIPFSTMEFHYFDLFRTQTATGHSGYFDSAFWTRRVLQECHTDPAIRHAAVALGALYKTLEQSCNPSSPSSSNGADDTLSHWQVAVKKYSEACNAMVSPNGLNSQTCHRTKLMASVLLGSFDAFIGDHKQAIIQIQSGLRLLERLRIEQAQRIPGAEPIEDELIIVFTRLAIQAKTYDLGFHFPEPYVIHLTPLAANEAPGFAAEQKSAFSAIAPLNQPFTSLREARIAHDRLLERGLRFVEMLHIAQNHAASFFPESWRQYGAGFKIEVETWVRAFQPLFESRLAPGMDHQEKTALAILKMAQINASVTFTSMFDSSEAVFDRFNPQFRAMVDLGREIVADEARAAAERGPNPKHCRHCHGYQPDDTKPGEFISCHIKPSFSADVGIVPPLFVVATKCRDPVLRRQAIQLLRSSARREGMWDSELIARIGQWIMELEEANDPAYEVAQQHVGDISYGGSYVPPEPYFQTSEQPPPQPRLKPVPEEKRVMIHSVDFDLRARFANLKVGTRGLRLGDGQDDRRTATHLSW